MFTGLVEGQGQVIRLTPGAGDLTLTLQVPFAEPGELGESVAINGCCLTLIHSTGQDWSFEAGSETLSKTNLGELAEGSRVNLERSLPVNGRLGGHFVQGHVDGTGQVDRIDREGQWVKMWFRVPGELARLMVPKGSVAVDGISLTLVDVEKERFSIALIPHTLEVTTLGQRLPGDRVNIETDILGKYVSKLLGSGSETA